METQPPAPKAKKQNSPTPQGKVQGLLTAWAASSALGVAAVDGKVPSSCKWLAVGGYIFGILWFIGAD
jgi:hypothetical protein